MRKIMIAACGATFGLLTAACGTTPTERAATGALGGAAVGAAVSGDATGALIGAGVGGIAGAATAPPRYERGH
jgi:membrane associated rhomboid family serine protease